MKAHQDWHEGIAEEISKLKDRLSAIDQSRYKLSLFLRMAERVACFSDDCEGCQDLRTKITGLKEDLICSQQMTPEEYGNYRTTIKGITRHLKRKHRLVDERQYIKRFVSASVALGLSLIMFGYILLSFGITVLVLSITLPALILRVIFGGTIGYLLDKRAKRQGRVI